MSNVKIPVKYFAQVADACVDLYDAGAYRAVRERQFEWSECEYYNYALETELTEGVLGDDGLPVAVGGTGLTNRGLDFARWWSEVEGVSALREGELEFAEQGGDLIYVSEDFQPVDGLFTMQAVVPVAVQRSGREGLEISADDDTWVYVNGHLVLDMGGVHEAASGRLEIREDGEIYAGVGTTELAYSGVRIDDGVARAEIAIFHANRDSGTQSVMGLRLHNLTVLASAAGEGGYVEPLGESLTVMGYVEARASAIIGETATLMAIMLVALGIIFAVRRYWLHGRSLE